MVYVQLWYIAGYIKVILLTPFATEIQNILEEGFNIEEISFWVFPSWNKFATVETHTTVRNFS